MALIAADWSSEETSYTLTQKYNVTLTYVGTVQDLPLTSEAMLPPFLFSARRTPTSQFSLLVNIFKPSANYSMTLPSHHNHVLSITSLSFVISHT